MLLKQNPKEVSVKRASNVLCCQVDIISLVAKERMEEIVIKRMNCKCFMELKRLNKEVHLKNTQKSSKVSFVLRLLTLCLPYCICCVISIDYIGCV